MAIPSHPAPAPPSRAHRGGNSVENKPSILLTSEENKLVFQLLGKRCFTLATAVVQLVKSQPPTHTKWVKLYTGVACFVKDNQKRSYFIRVFNLDMPQSEPWQQELYTTFEYRCPRPYFHTFEADEGMAGLSFADEREAVTFRGAVEEKLRIRQQKKMETRRRSSGGQNGTMAVTNIVPTSHGVSGHSKSQMDIHHNNNLYKTKEKKPKKGQKPKLTKNDIGLPTNFVHKQHIGWNPETGFDLAGVKPDLKQFFQMAGVSEKELKDDDTRKFIYQFIDSHGGVDKAIESIKSPPVPPVSQPVTAPPVPPSRTNSNAWHQPTYQPQTTKLAAPPPPPPPPPSMSSNHGAPPPPPPPPPPSDWNSPPAPPPPPASNGRAPPPPSNNNNKSLPPQRHPGIGGDSRNALLEQIRSGASLKHIDPESDSIKSNNSSGGGSSGGGRDALLNQIRSGVNLKRVETNAEKPVSDVGSGGGLAAALAKALQDRTRVMQQTDESSSESDNDAPDDDEWDD